MGGFENLRKMRVKYRTSIESCKIDRGKERGFRVDISHKESNAIRMKTRSDPLYNS